MSIFQNYSRATGPKTSAVQAELDRAKYANLAKQRKNALQSQNMLGASMIYNEAMGDKSPIADSIFGTDAATADAATADAATADAATADAGMTALPEATTATMGETSMAPAIAQTAAGTGAQAIPLLDAGAAGAAGAEAAGAGAATGSSGILASMGPVGWAALAAMALANFG